MSKNGSSQLAGGRRFAPLDIDRWRDVKPVQPVRPLYAGLKAAVGRIRSFGAWALWTGLRRGPRLGRRRISRRLPRETPAIADLSLLAHVAFHYAPDRLKYLDETVSQLRRLPVARVDVRVDTNVPATVGPVRRIAPEAKVNVWSDLEDPFKLTWTHRGPMKAALEAYDLFLYVEDDMYLPEQTLARWIEEAPRLDALGFVYGFVRVEEDAAGDLYLSDYRWPLKDATQVEIDGRRYLVNPFPYQGCWICTREQMRRFVETETYAEGARISGRISEVSPRLGVRERVAVGPTYDDVPEELQSRSLLPLTEDNHIAPEALVFHLPCNYAQRPRRHRAGIGTVPLAGAIAPDCVWRTHVPKPVSRAKR